MKFLIITAMICLAITSCKSEKQENSAKFFELTAKPSEGQRLCFLGVHESWDSTSKAWIGLDHRLSFGDYEKPKKQILKLIEMGNTGLPNQLADGKPTKRTCLWSPSVCEKQVDYQNQYDEKKQLHEDNPLVRIEKRDGSRVYQRKNGGKTYTCNTRNGRFAPKLDFYP